MEPFFYIIGAIIVVLLLLLWVHHVDDNKKIRKVMRVLRIPPQYKEQLKHLLLRLYTKDSKPIETYSDAMFQEHIFRTQPLEVQHIMSEVERLIRDELDNQYQKSMWEEGNSKYMIPKEAYYI